MQGVFETIRQNNSRYAATVVFHESTLFCSIVFTDISNRACENVHHFKKYFHLVHISLPFLVFHYIPSRFFMGHDVYREIKIKVHESACRYTCKHESHSFVQFLLDYNICFRLSLSLTASLRLPNGVPRLHFLSSLSQYHNIVYFHITCGTTGTFIQKMVFSLVLPLPMVYISEHMNQVNENAKKSPTFPNLSCYSNSNRISYILSQFYWQLLRI